MKSITRKFDGQQVLVCVVKEVKPEITRFLIARYTARTCMSFLPFSISCILAWMFRFLAWWSMLAGIIWISPCVFLPGNIFICCWWHPWYLVLHIISIVVVSFSCVIHINAFVLRSRSSGKNSLEVIFGS